MNLTKATNLFVLEMARHAHFNKDAKHYIRQLEKNNVELVTSKLTDYSFVAKTNNDVLRVIKYRMIGRKNADQKDPEEITMHPVQSDEVDVLKFDSVWKPDYNFRETIYREISEGIEIVTNNEFIIEKVYCDYYMNHPDIYSRTLDTKGIYEPGDDQGLMLTNSNQEDIIAELAVLYSSINVNDVQTFNMKKDEILSSLSFIKSKLN